MCVKFSFFSKIVTIGTNLVSSLRMKLLYLLMRNSAFYVMYRDTLKAAKAEFYEIQYT
jgi:hypothetical protein